jgi:hypothetical protein
MQTRFVIAAVLFLAWSAAMLCSGLYVGALAGRLGKANAAQKLAADRLEEVIAEQKVDREDRKKLQKALDALPKSEKKQRDLVRANPSKCDRPAAVADGLQDARNKANAARALPSDS